MATMACASIWMGSLNLMVAPGQVIWPRNFQTMGAGLLYVPISTAAYLYLSKEQINNASGLFNLIRNEGSSIGVAVCNTLLQRRAQFHQSRLSEHIHSFNPISNQWLQGISGAFQRVGSDPVAASRRGLRMMYQVVQQQAMALSYFDLFWLFAMLSFAVIPLVFFMKRSVSDGGNIAAH
jgi:DHA2 family multidrug resistance protein